MKLLVTKRADDHMRAIARYIKQFDIDAALHTIETFEHSFELLTEQPALGIKIPINNLRKLIVPRTPYIILYRYTDELVEIISIFHTSRRWTNEI